ncbi:uncharacterized protein LOC120744687, partial [Simochromis diagramma]|uniref:uncharacterized protein LOC120744687 n=1 Tax=Simochromis diagramma TaxID=43689 RepID=UPI001A7EDFCC
GTFTLKKPSSNFSQTETGSRSATFNIHRVDFSDDGLYQCQYEKRISVTQFSSPLSDSVRISRYCNLSKPNISISPAGETLNDEGLYQCQYQESGPSHEFYSPTSDLFRLSVTVRLQRPSISLTSPNAGLVWGPEGAQITRGYSFVLTCSINSTFSSGHFILSFSGSNLTESAVNNSASFSFPVAEYEQQGNYSCVYEVTVSTRTFRSAVIAPISVIIKYMSLMMLVSSVSVGVLLLLLLLPLVMWLLCRRSRATKQPEILVQSQMSVRVRNNYINAYERMMRRTM